MSRFHELGEKEGFITVYPWGTDRTQWNSFLAPDGADDIGYTVALIQYMKEHYQLIRKESTCQASAMEQDRRRQWQCSTRN